jgi:hypothetical protein
MEWVAVDHQKHGVVADVMLLFVMSADENHVLKQAWFV